MSIKTIKTDFVYEKDQFYTKPEIAKYCFSFVEEIYNLDGYDLILEPSAGLGSFFDLFPVNKRAGIELDYNLCVKNNDFICGSFFDFSFPGKRTIVIGNPPFGTQNSLSVKFFNHAAVFADVIAFIVPKTWKKPSVQNRLDLNFRLVKSVDLPDNCFMGKKHTAVKCCFQIWERAGQCRRKKKEVISHPDWGFLSYIKTEDDLLPPSNADFVVLAYGSNSGQVSKDLNRWRPKSVHFIKSNIPTEELLQRFQSLDYTLSDDSARQSSLGKAALVGLYRKKYGR